MKGMKKPIRFLIIISALAAMFSGTASAALDPGLVNGELAGQGIPDGWEVLAYEAEGYSVTAENGEVTITARGENDIRLQQNVKVDAGTTYRLTADIAAENVIGGKGATLSIDNFSLDGTYIYSANIIGNTDWTKVELVFRTGAEQTVINVALRLGGYSEMSSGTARFRAVTLEETSSGEMAQALGNSGMALLETAGSDELSEARQIQLKSFLHLFIVITVAVGVVLLCLVYRNLDAIGRWTLTEKRRRQFFLLAVLAGLVLRSVLCSAWGGHDSDMSCWIGWGNYIAQYGPKDFYTAPGHEWYDYPPGYMLILGFITKLYSFLHIPAGSSAMNFGYMLPAYAADVCIGLLMMKYARKNGFSEGLILLVGALAVFNPAAVMLSGAWGQIDSILTLFLLLSFTELMENRRISAGAIYGLAIMIKWQALIYGPVLAAAYLFRVRSKRDALETIAAVASALGVIFLVSLPFKGGQDAFWVVRKFLTASGGYDYASVEAYNFLALCGGNWKQSTTRILGGITYKTFGTIFIVGAVLLSILMQTREAYLGVAGKEKQKKGFSVDLLAAAFCMYMIFTFGHYMHERYVFPVIFLLMMVYILSGEKKFLLCSLLLSTVLLLNEMTAMYVISNLASAIVRGGREHLSVVTACSIMGTVSFFLFAYIAEVWLKTPVKAAKGKEGVRRG